MEPIYFPDESWIHSVLENDYTFVTQFVQPARFKKKTLSWENEILSLLLQDKTYTIHKTQDSHIEVMCLQVCQQNMYDVFPAGLMPTGGSHTGKLGSIYTIHGNVACTATNQLLGF